MKGVECIAILGGVRIPFARHNTNYVTASNLAMLTAALKAVGERIVLLGLRLGEVGAGAVLKHARDFNLARDATLSSGLAPQTPAYDVQQACAISLESTILVGKKIAVSQIQVGAARQLALHHRQTGRRCRSLISVCAAGGLGVTAILESE